MPPDWCFKSLRGVSARVLFFFYLDKLWKGNGDVYILRVHGRVEASPVAGGYKQVHAMGKLLRCVLGDGALIRYVLL